MSLPASSQAGFWALWVVEWGGGGFVIDQYVVTGP